VIGWPIEMSSALKAGAGVAAGANAGSGCLVSAAGAASVAPAKALPQTVAAMTATTAMIAMIAGVASSPVPSQAWPVKRRFEIWRRGIDRVLMRAVNKIFHTIISGKW
jgi:hypothetical protein